MSLDVCSPAYAVFLGSVHHPLAVDLELGHVQDDAGCRHFIEGLAHEALLQSGIHRGGRHCEDGRLRNGVCGGL